MRGAARPLTAAEQMCNMRLPRVAAVPFTPAALAMNPLRLAALVAAAVLLAACGPRHPQTEVFAAPVLAFDDGAPDVFTLASGTWVVAEASENCSADVHTISFDPQRQEMVLTYREPVDSIAPDGVVRYRVLSEGRRGAAGTPGIRVARESDGRQSGAAQASIWELVLLTRDRYQLRPSAPSGVVEPTGSFVRCEPAPAQEARAPEP